MSNLFTVIMAGGRGERLWPKSNNEFPKQFAKIVSNKSMLEETIKRCQMFSSNKRIHISTLKTNLPLIKKIIPRFPTSNIIVEPMIRDTACAILLATLSIPAQDQDILIFLPADHYLKHLDKFKNDVTAAFHNTQETGQATLIGITPIFAATEYGYLKIKSPDSRSAYKSTKGKILKVEKFVEKPNPRKAQNYFKSGNYLWNSGIFMFNRGYLVELFRKHTPKLYESINLYLKLIRAKKITQAQTVFQKIEKISFDYAIAEKISSIACVRSTFFWDDVGSWESLFRIKPKDNNGNIVVSREKSFVSDSHDNLLLVDDDRLVVLNGVKELIIISNNDKLYIAHRKSAGKIKTILKKLENEIKRKKTKKS